MGFFTILCDIDTPAIQGLLVSCITVVRRIAERIWWVKRQRAGMSKFSRLTKKVI